VPLSSALHLAPTASASAETAPRAGARPGRGFACKARRVPRLRVGIPGARAALARRGGRGRGGRGLRRAAHGGVGVLIGRVRLPRVVDVPAGGLGQRAMRLPRGPWPDTQLEAVPAGTTARRTVTCTRVIGRPPSPSPPTGRWQRATLHMQPSTLYTEQVRPRDTRAWLAASWRAAAAAWLSRPLRTGSSVCASPSAKRPPAARAASTAAYLRPSRSRRSAATAGAHRLLPGPLQSRTG